VAVTAAARIVAAAQTAGIPRFQAAVDKLHELRRQLARRCRDEPPTPRVERRCGNPDPRRELGHAHAARTLHVEGFGVPRRQCAATGRPRSNVDSAHVGNLAVARAGSMGGLRCRRTLTVIPAVCRPSGSS
jgi:hypothetical protein